MIPRLRRVRLMARRTRLLRGSALLIVLLLTAVLAWVYMAPRKSSFLVEGATYSATIHYLADAQRNNWRLAPGVIVCYWMDPQSTDTQVSSDILDNATSKNEGSKHGLCRAKQYRVRETSNALEFYWPTGTRIELVSGQHGQLIVDIIDAPKDGVSMEALDQPITTFSRLVVPRKVFLESGMLPFSGELTIGKVASAGERRILQRGRYSIRERLPGRSNQIVVSSGELSKGDEIKFRHRFNNEEPITTFGFVSAFFSEGPEAGNVPFELVSYTELEYSEMQVRRYASVPNVVRPRWTGRAIHDPLVLGLTVVLTFSALCISIVAESYLLLARPATGSDTARNAEEQEHGPATTVAVNDAESQNSELSPTGHNSIRKTSTEEDSH